MMPIQEDLKKFADAHDENREQRNKDRKVKAKTDMMCNNYKATDLKTKNSKT